MKLSIITINYNNAAGLKKTLDSVAEQTWCEFEHIIIDGGSTDKSVDVIQTYADLYAEKYPIRWISERDRGIYDAMNKGIKMAIGEYCLFMNGGDVINDSQSLYDIFRIGLSADIVCADSLFEESNIHKAKYIKSPDTIVASHLILSYLPHQSSFIKKELFENIHLYDTNFRIVSDWLFFIEAILVYQVSYQKINLLFSRCETEGLSNNPENCSLMNEEFLRGMRKVLPMFLDDYVELRELRRTMQDPKFLFFRRYRNNLCFRIIWKLYKLKNHIKNKHV